MPDTSSSGHRIQKPAHPLVTQESSGFHRFFGWRIAKMKRTNGTHRVPADVSIDFAALMMIALDSQPFSVVLSIVVNWIGIGMQIWEIGKGVKCRCATSSQCRSKS